MSLDKLNKFLKAEEPAQVVAPSQEKKPVDYSKRFSYFFATVAVLGGLHSTQHLERAGVPVPFGIADTVKTVENAAISAIKDLSPSRRRANELLQADQDGADKEGFASVAGIYQKYILHGRTNEQNRSVQLDALGRAVTEHSKNECNIKVIRADYSKGYDTPSMRAFALIHEDMRCRTQPYIAFDSVLEAKNDAEATALSERYISLVTESAADAMGILMIARRDGVEEAQKVLRKVYSARSDVEYESRYPDTRETLKLVADELTWLAKPGNQTSDAQTFSRAIALGARGAAAAMAKKSAPEEFGLMDGATFQQAIGALSKGMMAAVDAYHHGDKSMAEVTLKSGASEVNVDFGGHMKLDVPYALDLDRQGEAARAAISNTHVVVEFASCNIVNDAYELGRIPTHKTCISSRP